MNSQWNRIAAVALVVGVAGIGAAYSRRDVERAVRSLSQERENAFQSGGFRAAAALTGTYERTEEAPGHLGPASLEELVRSSEVILVAHVLSNHGVIPASGDVIRTHYQVEVRRVLKGERVLAGRGTAVVSILGGRASLGNGSWAQLNVRSSDLPLNGKDYLLFLNRVPADAKERVLALDTSDADFWPAHAFAGVVGLDMDGTQLRPADRRRGGGRPFADRLRRPSDALDDVARLSRASWK